MQQAVTADGNNGAFQLPAGLWELSMTGTVGGSTTVALYAGGSSDTSEHVQVTDPAGSDVISTAGAYIEPTLVQGGGWRSLVAASFSGSSSLFVNFRRAEPSV